MNFTDYLQSIFDIELDELYPTYEIAGVTLYPAQILSKCDPIARNEAFKDWIDAHDTSELESKVEAFKDDWEESYAESRFHAAEARNEANAVGNYL